MEMRLVLDPRLEIDDESFAAQWRENPDSLALGTFAVVRSGQQTFNEPSAMLTFIGGIAVGVLPNALWDGIKLAYRRLCAKENKPAQKVELQQLKQPDGTEILVLRSYE